MDKTALVAIALELSQWLPDDPLDIDSVLAIAREAKICALAAACRLEAKKAQGASLGVS